MHILLSALRSVHLCHNSSRKVLITEAFDWLSVVRLCCTSLRIRASCREHTSCYVYLFQVPILNLLFLDDCVLKFSHVCLVLTFVSLDFADWSRLMVFSILSHFCCSLCILILLINVYVVISMNYEVRNVQSYIFQRVQNACLASL